MENKLKYSLVGVFFIGMVLIATFVIPPMGNIQNDEEDALNFGWSEWSPGDIFYYHLGDAYYNANKSINHRNFGSLLKSEIIQIGDLSVDNDALDDIVFLSSMMVGDELVGMETPVLYDIYQLFSLISILTGEESYDPISGEFFRFFSEPSAIHVALSAFYLSLIELSQRFPDPENVLDLLTDGAGGLFFEASENDEVILDLGALAAQLSTFIFSDYSFVDDAEGTLPLDFKWISDDKLENLIQIVYTAYARYGNMLSLSQSGIQSDQSTLEWDYFLSRNYTGGVENILNYLYYSEANRFDFVFDFDIKSGRNTTIELGQDFKHVSKDKIPFVDLWREGFNGMKLIFNQTAVSYQMGTKKFDGTLIVDIPSEDRYNYTEIFKYSDVSNLNFSKPIRYLISPKSNSFNITLIQLVEGTYVYEQFGPLQYYLEEIDEEDVKFYTDSALELWRYGDFVALNHHKLRIIQNESNTQGTDLFDDFTYENARIVDLSTGRVMSADNLIMQTLGLGISFYHFLLLPDTFDIGVINFFMAYINIIFDKIISYLDESGIYEAAGDQYLLELEKLGYSEEDQELPYGAFQVTETEELLSVELDERVWIMIIALLENILGSNIRFLTGNHMLGFKMSWNKQARMFNELKVLITMPEIDITREIGIKLVCTTRLNDGVSDTIPKEYSLFSDATLMALIDANYDMILDYLWTRNWAILLGITLGLIGSSVGINSLIQYLTKRKKLGLY